ncbi:MAG: SMP-30/gluconolactonase/LRE family protein [Microthrixaceae bacterium]|nr:SMP-30/gluconolactonase/LRE family protein [Acidimicrobiales bacterium]MCB9404860.1 SMP-30/gluconolactonase/LRE family protein [Microthrixaceae bacterium]
MTERTLSTLLDGGGFFEGPRWRDGSWWVSDFYRHIVSRVDPDGTETVVVEVAAQPSGLGWLPDGSLVISSMKDHRLLRFADGQLTEHADLTGMVGGHLNDLVVSSAGQVFVGNFGFDLMGGGAPANADLIRVDLDGTATVVAADMRFPNGAVITPDGSTLIVGETTGNRYTAFTIGPDGSLTDRRPWAEFAPIPGDGSFAEQLAQVVVAPDGCTLDAEGHIWAADALGNRAVRVAPGGAIVEEVPGPDGLGVYACQLGGPDGTTLLLCCAPDFFEHTRSVAREARLVTLEVDVPHAGLP